MAEEQNERFVDALWNLSFYTISVVIIHFYLIPCRLLVGINIEQILERIMTRDDCNKEVAVVLDEKIFFALILSFAIWDTLNLLSKNIINKKEQTYLKLLYCLFMVTSFYLRGFKFALMFFMFTGVLNVLKESSKLLYNVNCTSGYRILKLLSEMILFVYITLWCGLYLLLIPQLLFIGSNDDISFNQYSSFNVILWSYVVFETVSSVTIRVILSLALKKSLVVNLEYYLYGVDKSHDEKVKSQGQDDQQNEHNVLQNSIYKKNKIKENVSAVYQTIRCYMRVKRKLKQTRKKIDEKKKELEMMEGY